MKSSVALLILLVIIGTPVYADPWIANCGASSTNNEGGELRVNTAPDGALVTIDGRDLGTTPYMEDVTMRGISYGSHTLTLTKTGYQTASFRFDLCSGFLTDVRTDLISATPETTATTIPATTEIHGQDASALPGDAELSPEHEAMGSLAVMTNPQGAEVYVDGSLKGISPVSVEKLTPGIHALDLKLLGYQDNTARIAITAGQKQTYSVTLKPGTENPAGTAATSYAPGFGALLPIMAAGCLLFLRVHR